VMRLERKLLRIEEEMRDRAALDRAFLENIIKTMGHQFEVGHKMIQHETSTMASALYRLEKQLDKTAAMTKEKMTALDHSVEVIEAKIGVVLPGQREQEDTTSVMETLDATTTASRVVDDSDLSDVHCRLDRLEEHVALGKVQSKIDGDSARLAHMSVCMEKTLEGLTTFLTLCDSGERDPVAKPNETAAHLQHAMACQMEGFLADLAVRLDTRVDAMHTPLLENLNKGSRGFMSVLDKLDHVQGRCDEEPLRTALTSATTNDFLNSAK